jgi:broad specificity phosphatase PhoE
MTRAVDPLIILCLSLLIPISIVTSFSCHHVHNERRSFLQTLLVVGLPPPELSNAIEDASHLPPISTANGNFDCLLDLPPITPGCVRIYLCRHGQTEFNRLHKVQGARIDPPLNQNGREQAKRLGMAVSKLITNNDTFPHYVVHSPLCRARETAEVVTATALSQFKSKGIPTTDSLKVFGELPSLKEVDFGSLEGMMDSDNTFRMAMTKTYANWSIGNIDSRTGIGGESGREVLQRAVRSLDELGKLAASSSSSSILAVSHSTYLRLLLSMVSDKPLAESALWKIDNGSVNIVDVNVERKRQMFTSIDMPQAHLIRLNEVRHLQGIIMS